MGLFKPDPPKQAPPTIRADTPIEKPTNFSSLIGGSGSSAIPPLGRKAKIQKSSLIGGA